MTWRGTLINKYFLQVIIMIVLVHAKQKIRLMNLSRLEYWFLIYMRERYLKSREMVSNIQIRGYNVLQVSEEFAFLLKSMFLM